MAYKEPKLNKNDIHTIYDVLGSLLERPKGGKGKKPGTVKRSGNKTSKKR